MSYLDSLFDLSGKVALVTGGSRGLGREMAFGFARAGADVVVASRNVASCQEVAHQIEAETGRRALAHSVHVGRWDQLDGLVETALATFGRIDVLVNNAGMSPLYDGLPAVSERLFDSVVNLNFKGPFRLSVLCAEQMVSQGGGAIINVSSTGSLRPTGGIVPYAGAKAALNAMSLGLAQAYGPTVRVNTLMSGTMQTDISLSWDMEAFNAAVVDQNALQRIGQPSEIVGAAIYLASDASSYTTGATLRVDGGIP